MADEANFLEVRDLHKSFHGAHALKGVSIRI